ncbi:hypothetical protein [Mycolicibacterium sp. 050158]|uniref:hypothetical protein n=1 Tax=Mycolicibacterium sp. 050158 TaxID=3090602 RepID=UPI00299CF794|nr:hypothetical protein [Mycolicibacterium sp. 050158]MDX1890023.1 hypothetical protein [Mycolicibacterium sp. 050158]
MIVRWGVVGTVAVAIAATMSIPGAVATASPATPCTAELDGAMTWPTGASAPLVCAGNQWQPVTDPYPTSDQWVSDGSTMTLHGQGRPNPNLLSGNWTATPLDPETRCEATQLAVIPGSPTVGAPRVDGAPAGQPLTLQVVPVLFTIEMRGDCLWQKVR